MSTITVYCSWECADQAMFDVAAETGRRLGLAGFDVVFGGGGTGPMGTLGLSALAAGSRVTSVTCPGWVDEHDHRFHDLLVRPSMSERMAAMERLADGFLVLPGGLGMAAELFSCWKLACNGPSRPVVVVDPAGHFTGLWSVVRGWAASGFVSERAWDLVAVCRSPVEAVAELGSRLGRRPALARPN